MVAALSMVLAASWPPLCSLLVQGAAVADYDGAFINARVV